MDIATWAREYFGKSLSLNTVCCCIKKCNLKLYYAKRKAFINFVQKRSPKSSEMDRKTVFLLHVKDHPDCYQPKLQKPASVMVLECLSSHGMGDLWKYHWCGGLCWRDICLQDDNFSQELHVYFSRAMPGLILLELQQRGFVGIECVCLTGLPAIQICLLLKMYTASWRGESGHGNHWLLSSSSLVYTKNSTCKTATIDIFNW